MAGFEARLRALFPARSARCTPKAAIDISLAHVLESAALALQARPAARSPSAAPRHDRDRRYQVVVEYSEEAVGRQAFEDAQALIAPRWAGGFDCDAALAELRELDEDERLGPSTGAIVDAAAARGIPWRRLTRAAWCSSAGAARQRRIQAAEVDSTSAVSESIAQDKDLTKRLLHAAGVPVPMGRPVADVDDAWAVALESACPWWSSRRTATRARASRSTSPSARSWR
jgi:cyanophycin synthetase